MQYPVEFITGIMVTSAAFIMITGIVMGFAGGKEKLGKWYSIMLLISLGLGAIAITSSLVWFDRPSDLRKLLAIGSLFLQFVILWVPFTRLLGLIEKR